MFASKWCQTKKMAVTGGGQDVAKVFYHKLFFLMSRSVKADEFFISIQLFFQKMIPLKPDLEEPERWANGHGVEAVCET